MRLLKKRMYQLENGDLYFYFGKWDNAGGIWGKMMNKEGTALMNICLHRSQLANAKLIPIGEEPWLPETIARTGRMA